MSNRDDRIIFVIGHEILLTDLHEKYGIEQPFAVSVSKDGSLFLGLQHEPKTELLQAVDGGSLSLIDGRNWNCEEDLEESVPGIHSKGIAVEDDFKSVEAVLVLHLFRCKISGIYLNMRLAELLSSREVGGERYVAPFSSIVRLKRNRGIFGHGILLRSGFVIMNRSCYDIGLSGLECDVSCREPARFDASVVNIGLFQEFAVVKLHGDFRGLGLPVHWLGTSNVFAFPRDEYAHAIQYVCQQDDAISQIRGVVVTTELPPPKQKSLSMSLGPLVASRAFVRLSIGKIAWSGILITSGFVLTSSHFVKTFSLALLDCYWNGRMLKVDDNCIELNGVLCVAICNWDADLAAAAVPLRPNGQVRSEYVVRSSLFEEQVVLNDSKCFLCASTWIATDVGRPVFSLIGEPQLLSVSHVVLSVEHAYASVNSCVDLLTNHPGVSAPIRWKNKMGEEIELHLEVVLQIPLLRRVFVTRDASLEEIPEITCVMWNVIACAIVDGAALLEAYIWEKGVFDDFVRACALLGLDNFFADGVRCEFNGNWGNALLTDLQRLFLDIQLALNVTEICILKGGQCNSWYVILNRTDGKKLPVKCMVKSEFCKNYSVIPCSLNVEGLPSLPDCKGFLRTYNCSFKLSVLEKWFPLIATQNFCGPGALFGTTEAQDPKIEDFFYSRSLKECAQFPNAKFASSFAGSVGVCFYRWGCEGHFKVENNAVGLHLGSQECPLHCSEYFLQVVVRAVLQKDEIAISLMISEMQDLGNGFMYLIAARALCAEKLLESILSQSEGVMDEISKIHSSEQAIGTFEDHFWRVFEVSDSLRTFLEIDFLFAQDTAKDMLKVCFVEDEQKGTKRWNYWVEKAGSLRLGTFIQGSDVDAVIVVSVGNDAPEYVKDNPIPFVTKEIVKEFYNNVSSHQVRSANPWHKARLTLRSESGGLVDVLVGLKKPGKWLMLPPHGNKTMDSCSAGWNFFTSCCKMIPRLRNVASCVRHLVEFGWNIYHVRKEDGHVGGAAVDAVVCKLYYILADLLRNCQGVAVVLRKVIDSLYHCESVSPLNAPGVPLLTGRLDKFKQWLNKILCLDDANLVLLCLKCKALANCRKNNCFVVKMADVQTGPLSSSLHILPSFLVVQIEDLVKECRDNDAANKDDYVLDEQELLWAKQGTSERRGSTGPTVRSQTGSNDVANHEAKMHVVWSKEELDRVLKEFACGDHSEDQLQTLSNRIIVEADGDGIRIVRELGDGHCGFRGVARQLGNVSYVEVRRRSLRELKEERTYYEQKFADVLEEISQQELGLRDAEACKVTECWMTSLALQAVSDSFNIHIKAYHSGLGDLLEVYAPRRGRGLSMVRLIYWDRLHFDSVVFVDRAQLVERKLNQSKENAKGAKQYLEEIGDKNLETLKTARLMKSEEARLQKRSELDRLLECFGDYHASWIDFADEQQIMSVGSLQELGESAFQALISRAPTVFLQEALKSLREKRNEVLEKAKEAPMKSSVKLMANRKQSKTEVLRQMGKKSLCFKKYCVSCGKALDAQWAFCNFCGNQNH
jgi:hypothetical protein